MKPVRIIAVGATTSIGAGAVQTDASLRAGLCRFREGPWPQGEDSVTLAMVRAEILADAQAQASAVRGPSPMAADAWPARLAALAGLALADALASVEVKRPVVLLLGLPDPRECPLAVPPLWAAVSAISGVAIDAGRSQVYPRGRAAIFDALATGRELLEREPDALVVCGGVDSYIDPKRVEVEYGATRTLGSRFAGDGRTLGEAAGMLVLEASASRRGGLVVAGLGRVDDPGHRFGTAPARGEGLANAIEALRGEVDPRVPFGTVWAGLNGEVHDAKLWGTACLRHRDLLTAGARIEHPADRLGDAGAGLGAMLLVDAHMRLVAGRRPAPALVWAVSDHGPCGCAMVLPDAPGASR